MSKATLVPLFFGLSALVAGPTLADEIWLTNGRLLTGEARVAADGGVEVFSAAGSMTLPARLVARIERTPSVERLVEARRAFLPPGDSEALYQLGRWASEQGAATLARRIFEDVLALDGDHPGARRLLGYRRHQDRWVSESEYHALRGEVYFRGAWQPGSEVQRVLAWETATAQAQAERHREAAWRARQEAEYARLEADLARQAAVDDYGPLYPYGLSWGLPGVVIVDKPHRPPKAHEPDSPHRRTDRGRMDRRPPPRDKPQPGRPSRLVGARPGPSSPAPRGSRPSGS